MVFCCSGLAVINGRPDEACQPASPAKKAPLISHALRPWNDCSSSFHCTGNQDSENLTHSTHLSLFYFSYWFILWNLIRPSCIGHCIQMASRMYGCVLFYVLKCVMIWSDILKWSEVKWVTVKFVGTKLPCTLGWPYTGCTSQDCEYFMWRVSLGPPLWSSSQSFWLQIQRSRVRFPALPDFLSSSGSGTGSTQHREVNWGVTWIKSSGSGPENRD